MKAIIVWTLTNHDYSMTVHLDDDVIQHAIESLKQWIKYNHQRIEDWEIYYNDTEIPSSKRDIIKIIIAQTMLLPQNNG